MRAVGKAARDPTAAGDAPTTAEGANAAGATMTGTMMGRGASEAAAALRGMSSSSVGEGPDGGEMDDEADSAWVHGKG